MLKKISLVVLGLLLFHSSANGAVYKWVDEKGGIHFSDQPPPATRAVSTQVSAQPTADKPQARSFPLPQHGNLILSVPQSWDHEIRQSQENLPPTIELTPRAGDDFAVLITPFWNLGDKPGFNNAEASKGLIDKALARMLPTAVEKDVPIQEIRGKDGVGYYFLVTDKSPGTGYPYAVQAAIGVGDLHLFVTVLCRTRESEGLRQTLQALQGAVHKKG